MIRYISITCFLILSFSSFAQQGFQFPEGVDEIEIPFKSAFNLIVLPVEVNGTDLQMILDTGASRSIIFNFSGIDSLTVQRGNLLKINGYGEDDFFQAYYSEGNTLDVEGYRNPNASFFIAAEKEVNLEATMGFPVHGLLGADFFKNALVYIDYLNARVIVYKATERNRSRMRFRKRIPMKFKDTKPYIDAVVSNGSIKEVASELLVDTGSGDALWLFEKPEGFEGDRKGFDDYLGFGMNGEIYGRRSKVDLLRFGTFSMSDVTVSFPITKDQGQKSKTESVIKGSIGGEVLSRFDVVFDYQKQLLYLDSNEEFKYGFYYNMAGIELIAGEKELITSIVDQRNKVVNGVYKKVEGQKTITTNRRYNYARIPKIMVKYIRPNSPADLAGIREGDEIIAINTDEKGSMLLNDVASRFYKNPNTKLRIKVKRGEKTLRFNLKLVPLI